MYQILGTLANQENNRLMQTAAAAALGDCLDHVDGRPFGLRSEATVPNLLPEPKVITLELFDGQWRQLSDPQRLGCVRAKRAVVELTARFASSSFLQWSAHNESFWRDTLLARLRDQARQHEVLLYSDQVWLIEQNVLPKLCISLRLQDLCAEDMKWYLEFIKLSSAELFSEEQLTLLKRVEATNRKRITQQVIVEVELQFKFCKLNAEHLYALTNALEQADHVQSSEPTKYPVKYDVTSLWIGGNQLKDMSDLQSLTELVVSPFTRIGHLNFHWAFGDRMSMDAYRALKRLILRTLRDPHSTLRHLDLSYTPTGNTIIKNLFSALRESEQLHELSIDGLKTIPESSAGDFMNDRWAWIAFGLLHEDSCSQVHHLSITGMHASAENVAVVRRILASAHPGRELLLTVEPDLQSQIETQEIPLPAHERLFVTFQPETELRTDRSERYVFHEFVPSNTGEEQWEVMLMLTEWVCVNAPGFGPIWAPTQSIATQATKLSVVKSARRARSSPTLKTLDWSVSNSDTLSSLLPLLGHSLESLNLAYVDISAADLQSILTNCPRLRYLNAHSLIDKDISLLPTAYLEYNCQIERLDICARNGVQATLHHFAQILAHPTGRPLRQLSFSVKNVDLPAIDSFVAACRANKTLEVLRVHTNVRSESERAVQSKLSPLDNEMLAIRTPDAVKWAFLGVLHHSTDTSLRQFDAAIASRILRFAGSRIRRQIFWFH